MRKCRTKVPLDALDAVVSAYRHGIATTDLAAALGVTTPALTYHLNKLQVPRRSRGETNRMRAPVDLDELRRLVDQAVLSQREIAQSLGVSPATIQRTLRDLLLKSKRGRGSPLAKNFFWRGGVRTEPEGYVLLKLHGGGYVREHRAVMEGVLGRPLLKREVVHHRDGNPRNNDPSNLQVFATNADHIAFHWRESWADALETQRAKYRNTLARQ